MWCVRAGTLVATVGGVGSGLVGDRYRILSLIGRGGMGNVFRAEHTALRREVALKVLAAPTGAARSEFVERFAREAQASARLDHPGCVRILDYGADARGEPFIAMELIEGPTLAAALKSGPFSVARALHVARGVLAALAHAHRHGVVHRDVKPENVMFAVTSGFRIVLIDFGLASLANAPALTGNGMAMGSPSYIAPERLLGQPHGPRGDLYAVGVILYEMLAGVRPFEGETPQAIMQRALERPARPLRSLRSDVPDVLDAVIRRAMQKDPAKRFGDAEEMLSALADVTALEAARAADEEPADDASASMTVAMVSFERPSVLARLWSWIRYGRWRWRPT